MLENPFALEHKTSKLSWTYRGVLVCGSGVCNLVFFYSLDVVSSCLVNCVCVCEQFVGLPLQLQQVVITSFSIYSKKN